jgi:hypothetical protein
LVGGIGQGKLLDLPPEVQRHKEKYTGPDPIFHAGDPGIAEAMPAFIFVQRSSGWFPPRVPNCFAILDIEILSSVIDRHIVVPEPGNPPVFGILEESIPSGCIGYQAEEIFVAQVIDPGIGCLWILNYIFPVFVIKKSVSHIFKLFNYPLGDYSTRSFSE